MKQLQLLWDPKTVSLLFVDMIEFIEHNARSAASSTADDKKYGNFYLLIFVSPKKLLLLQQLSSHNKGLVPRQGNSNHSYYQHCI